MVEFLKTLAIACIPAIITGIVTYIVFIAKAYTVNSTNMSNYAINLKTRMRFE